MKQLDEESMLPDPERSYFVVPTLTSNEIFAIHRFDVTVEGSLGLIKSPYGNNFAGLTYQEALAIAADMATETGKTHHVMGLFATIEAEVESTCYIQAHEYCVDIDVTDIEDVETLQVSEG